MKFRGNILYLQALGAGTIKDRRQLSKLMGAAYPTTLKLTNTEYSARSLDKIGKMAEETVGLEAFGEMKVKDVFNLE